MYEGPIDEKTSRDEINDTLMQSKLLCVGHNLNHILSHVVRLKGRSTDT